jgi:hypothetical protein
MGSSSGPTLNLDIRGHGLPVTRFTAWLCWVVQGYRLNARGFLLHCEKTAVYDVINNWASGARD